MWCVKSTMTGKTASMDIVETGYNILDGVKGNIQ